MAKNYKGSSQTIGNNLDFGFNKLNERKLYANSNSGTSGQEDSDTSPITNSTFLNYDTFKKLESQKSIYDRIEDIGPLYQMTEEASGDPSKNPGNLIDIVKNMKGRRGMSENSTIESFDINKGTNQDFYQATGIPLVAGSISGRIIGNQLIIGGGEGYAQFPWGAVMGERNRLQKIIADAMKPVAKAEWKLPAISPTSHHFSGQADDEYRNELQNLIDISKANGTYGNLSKEGTDEWRKLQEITNNFNTKERQFEALSKEIDSASKLIEENKIYIPSEQRNLLNKIRSGNASYKEAQAFMESMTYIPAMDNVTKELITNVFTPMNEEISKFKDFKFEGNFNSYGTAVINEQNKYGFTLLDKDNNVIDAESLSKMTPQEIDAAYKRASEEFVRNRLSEHFDFEAENVPDKMVKAYANEIYLKTANKQVQKNLITYGSPPRVTNINVNNHNGEKTTTMPAFGANLYSSINSTGFVRLNKNEVAYASPGGGINIGGITYNVKDMSDNKELMVKIGQALMASGNSQKSVDELVTAYNNATNESDIVATGNRKVYKTDFNERAAKLNWKPNSAEYKYWINSPAFTVGFLNNGVVNGDMPVVAKFGNEYIKSGEVRNFDPNKKHGYYFSLTSVDGSVGIIPTGAAIKSIENASSNSIYEKGVGFDATKMTSGGFFKVVEKNGKTVLAVYEGNIDNVKDATLLGYYGYASFTGTFGEQFLQTPVELNKKLTKGNTNVPTSKDMASDGMTN